MVKITLLIALTAPHTASACSVCFGDPDSPWAKALGWGILVLLGIVTAVLGGIVAFFIHVAKRSRVLSQLTTQELATQEKLQP